MQRASLAIVTSLATTPVGCQQHANDGIEPDCDRQLTDRQLTDRHLTYGVTFLRFNVSPSAAMTKTPSTVPGSGTLLAV